MFLSATTWFTGYAPTVAWVEYPWSKLLAIPNSLVSWPAYDLESLNIIALIHLLMKKLLSSCYILDIVQYIQQTKNLKKPPTNQTLSRLERRFLLLSCKLLDCTAELLVSSK